MTKVDRSRRVLDQAFVTRYSSVQARLRATQLAERHHRLLLQLSLNLFRAGALLQRLQGSPKN